MLVIEQLVLSASDIPLASSALITLSVKAMGCVKMNSIILNQRMGGSILSKNNSVVVGVISWMLLATLDIEVSWFWLLCLSACKMNNKRENE